MLLLTSDARPGLVAEIWATLPGASWQRSSVKMGSGGVVRASIDGGGTVPLDHLLRRERTLAA